MSEENKTIENEGTDPSLEEMTGDEGGDDESSNANKTQDGKSAKPKKKRFLGEYLHELREENKSLRLQSEENLKKAEDERKLAAEERKASKDTLQKVEEKIKADQERIVRAELKVFATKAGILDIDDVRHIDLSAIKFSDDGDIVGAKEAIDALKAKKPHYFKQNSSSPSFGTPKPGEEIKPINAMSMTDEDYQKQNPKPWRK
jgi:hypothetical protein